MSSIYSMTHRVVASTGAAQQEPVVTDLAWLDQGQPSENRAVRRPKRSWGLAARLATCRKFDSGGFHSSGAGDHEQVIICILWGLDLRVSHFISGRLWQDNATHIADTT